MRNQDVRQATAPLNAWRCRSVTRMAVIGLTLSFVGGTAAWPQSAIMTITLTGQAMIRSDLRATAPAAMPRIRSLLKGDVIFTNLEGAVAEPGQSVHEGRGFLTPPEALDALKTFGFNLLSLAGNHAFDLNVTGVQNT